jgi:hypothetical protein
VAGGSGADSMLRFHLKREGDGLKHCQKMKQSQRARLDSMGRKHDTVRQRDDVSRRRDGTEEEKGRMQH